MGRSSDVEEKAVRPRFVKNDWLIFLNGLGSPADVVFEGRRKLMAQFGISSEKASQTVTYWLERDNPEVGE